MRDALGRRLIAINRTARLLGDPPHGLGRRFQLPRSKRQEMLVTAARGYAVAAKAHEVAFIAHGLPATFIADLLEFADRLNEVSQNQAAEKAERALAQVTIRATFVSGMVAARMLDVIMANRLIDDEPTLAGWHRARRLAARPGFRHLPAPYVPASPAPERQAL